MRTPGGVPRGPSRGPSVTEKESGCVRYTSGKRSAVRVRRCARIDRAERLWLEQVIELSDSERRRFPGERDHGIVDLD